MSLLRAVDHGPVPGDAVLARARKCLLARRQQRGEIGGLPAAGEAPLAQAGSPRTPPPTAAPARPAGRRPRRRWPGWRRRRPTGRCPERRPPGRSSRCRRRTGGATGRRWPRAPPQRPRARTADPQALSGSAVANCSISLASISGSTGRGWSNDAQAAARCDESSRRTPSRSASDGTPASAMLGTGTHAHLLSVTRGRPHLGHNISGLARGGTQAAPRRDGAIMTAGSVPEDVSARANVLCRSHGHPLHSRASRPRGRAAARARRPLRRPPGCLDGRVG